jgi:chromosome segregation protein
MTDSILAVSPENRKSFFEEAAGVKEYQIKREETINKLERTKENLSQAELILQEITPRLRSLTRQVKKLERREETEKELRKIQEIYYGGLWQEIESGIRNQESGISKIEREKLKLEKIVGEIQRQLGGLEKEAVESEGFRQLQKEYEKLLEEKNEMREKITRIDIQIKAKEFENNKKPVSLSISEIIQSLEEIYENLNQIERIEKIDEIKIKNKILREKLIKLIRILRGEVQEAKTEVPSELLRNFEETKNGLEKINESLKKIQEKISSFGQREEEKRKEIFGLQRKFQTKQNELNEIINQLNEIKIELARLETRKEDLEKEMVEEGIGEMSNVKCQVSNVNEEELKDEIHKLKHQLELIGGIDPEVVKEYKEIKERHEFLDGQSIDLKKAIESLEKVIAQLDEIIEKQFASAFKKINGEFERYFKILFNGGRAKLVLLKEEEPVLEDEDSFFLNSPLIKGVRGLSSPLIKGVRGLSSPFNTPLPPLIGGNKGVRGLSSPFNTPLPPLIGGNKGVRGLYKGVEIYATPPGKRLKNINMLSGGEKALASLALVCAIIRYTVSPFVVLDEVDAALDEANSAKFAKILEDLSHKIQFIVITHNRAVMEKAKVLYGVTMGDDGISKLLSVKLEDIVSGYMQDES